MSYKSLYWASQQKAPSSTDKLVLLQLASHVNSKTGLCNPSIATLASECIIAPRSVIRAIHSLEKAGLIRVIRTCSDGKKNSNMYRLSTGGVVTQVHYGSDTKSLGVVTQCHINQETESGNESISKKIEDRHIDSTSPVVLEAKAKLKAFLANVKAKGPPA